MLIWVDVEGRRGRNGKSIGLDGKEEGRAEASGVSVLNCTPSCYMD